MPRTAKPPAPSQFAMVFAALTRAGMVLSRDDVGYIACPCSAATSYYRERLDGAEASALVSQVYDWFTTKVCGIAEPIRFTGKLRGDVIQLLRARAARLPESPHFRRVASLENRVVIDRGEWGSWECIEITPRGWRLLPKPPRGVHLLRGAGTRALPDPVALRRRDFSPLQELHSLWPGIRGDRFAVLLAGLAWSLVSQRENLLLLLHGRSGIGKSALARLIRGVLDPHKLPYQGMPAKDATRNLLVAGLHERLLTLDNVSVVDREVADMLCQRLDGWAGARYRALQTNADLTIIPSAGPVLLTAIAPLTGHADLAERGITIGLQDVGDASADAAPIGAAELDRRVDALLPRLFGLLLSAASAGLAKAHEFAPVPGWRNQRFAAFAQAAAAVLGEPAKAMAASLAEMGEYQRRLVGDMAPVAGAVLDLAAREDAETLLPQGCVWRSTVTALLGELTKLPIVRQDPGFPRSGSALTEELLRLRAALRSNGIEIRFRRAATSARSPAGAQRWVELWRSDAPGQAPRDDPHDAAPGATLH
jgi:hypothetical protein